MSEKKYTPFLKWGNYKSKDKNNPDVLNVEIIDAEPFSTQYDLNVLCVVNGEEVNVPLRTKSSNKKLYRQYTSLLQQKKIKTGSKLVIKTWMSKSTRHPDYDLREFGVIA